MAVVVESISALQAFVLAGEKLSFKLAGQQMGLTASAVGKAIQRLEEQLSVRLFYRSTRSIRLTEEGARFQEHCRRVLAELEAAQAELAQAGATPRGRLKVSLPIASALFLPVIADFATHHQDIELDLDINDRFVDVIEEGFDVVIRSGEPQDSRLQHRTLARFSWHFVASPGYLTRCGTPRTVAELKTHRCVRHRFPETGRLAPWPVESDPDFSAASSLTTTTMDALVDLVERGVGIGYAPSVAVNGPLAAGRLVEVLHDVDRESGSLNLLWPASRYPLPRVRAFVDFLVSRLKA